MVAAFASRGFTVVGVDTDASRVEAVASLRAPVFEPGLQECLELAAGRITATTDTEAAVAATDLTMIVVPTPSDENGGFSLRYALPACQAVGRALGDKDAFHVVVMTSTVMPGSTGGPLLLALEEASGKQCSVDFGLCYSPEFIALGSVIHDFLNPDFLLIGESDARAGDVLASVYRAVCEREAPVARTNFVNAELAKLSVNTFVTTKIAFANMLARLCERLPEADVDAVTAAIGLDTRIGRRYLTGAISYGGPCFPRDNLALAALARSLEAPALLAEATDRANRMDIAVLAERLVAQSPPGGTVGILGLAYKPDTDVVEESAGLLLAQAVAAEGVRVVAYDPAAAENARRVAPAMELADTVEACLEQSDIVVVATPWAEFRRLPELLPRDGERRTVIDCWRILRSEDVAPVADYVALGEGGNAVRARVAPV